MTRTAWPLAFSLLVLVAAIICARPDVPVGEQRGGVGRGRCYLATWTAAIERARQW